MKQNSVLMCQTKLLVIFWRLWLNVCVCVLNLRLVILRSHRNLSLSANMALPSSSSSVGLHQPRPNRWVPQVPSFFLAYARTSATSSRCAVRAILLASDDASLSPSTYIQPLAYLTVLI